MNKDKQNVIEAVEKADGMLENMRATMQLAGLGLEAMANGEEVTKMLEHFRETILDIRAMLDDACGAVLRMEKTA